MRSISRVVVLLATMGAASAARAEVEVADVAEDGSESLSGVEYGVSEPLGRAWLVLHFTERGLCDRSEGDCDVDRPVRVRVPGLTFDPASQQVLFSEAGAAPVACAKVVRHRFVFGWESLDQTGACVYRAVKVKARVEDGFEGRVERRQEVYFGVKR